MKQVSQVEYSEFLGYLRVTSHAISDEVEFNSRVASYLAEHDLSDVMEFTISKKSGYELLMNDIEFTFGGGAILFDMGSLPNWVQQEIPQGLCIVSNCTFMSENGGEITIGGNFHGSTSKVVFEDSDLSKTILNFYRITRLVVRDSTKGLFRIVRTPGLDSIEFHNVQNIKEVTLNEDLRGLTIVNSTIDKLIFWSLLDSGKLRVFQFDERSQIKIDSYSTYLNLQALLRASGVNDKIQQHIIYNKELEEYVKNDYAGRDSRLLFWLSYVTSKNGRSFLLPIAWMLAFNFVFTLAIFYVEMPFASFFDLTIEAFWSSLNVIPIHSFLTDKSESIVVGFDGLRRILLAVFYYLTITAALRFKF